MILRQFFLISVDAKINTAFWSIRYEMELSLVFPLLCALLLKLRTAGSVILGCLCAVCGLWLVHYTAYPIIAEAGATVLWSSCFIFGAMLAKCREPIMNWYAQLSPVFRVGMFLVGLADFFSFHDAISIPCSCALIVAVQYGLPMRLLRTELPEYLGRISYSLYLLHGTILFALFILLYGKISPVLICLFYLLITFGLSHLFNRYAEEPFDRLGKSLTRKRQA